MAEAVDSTVSPQAETPPRPPQEHISPPVAEVVADLREKVKVKSPVKERVIEATARFAFALDGEVEAAARNVASVLERGRKVWGAALGKVREIKPKELIASLLDLPEDWAAAMARRFLTEQEELTKKRKAIETAYETESVRAGEVFANRKKAKEGEILERMKALRMESRERRGRAEETYGSKLPKILPEVAERKIKRFEELKQQRLVKVATLKEELNQFVEEESRKLREISEAAKRKLSKKSEPVLTKLERLERETPAQTWGLRAERWRRVSQKGRALLGIKEAKA